MRQGTLFDLQQAHESPQTPLESTRGEKRSHPTGQTPAGLRRPLSGKKDTEVEISERALAEAGAERAAAGAGAEWVARATAEAVLLARRGQPFSADEVWAAVGDCPGDPRAMGAVMRRLASEGVIRATGLYRPSRRPGCHARPVLLWEGVSP